MWVNSKVPVRDQSEGGINSSVGKVMKMAQISAREKVEKYFKIYEQIYEDPFVARSKIAKNTGMAYNTVKRYLTEMEDLMIGPVICVNPTQDYHEYVYFLQVENPLSENIKELSSVVMYMAMGNWNLLLVSNTSIDYSKLEGYQKCILQGIKGATFLSRVKMLDFDESMRKMHEMLHSPDRKSFLSDRIPSISWEDWEWALYHEFKYNVRTPPAPILERLKIPQNKYKKWVSSLSGDLIQVGFYPSGVNRYNRVDFLFESEYQKQVTDILGMLPSTSVFFSVGQYLLARLSFLTREEMEELYTFIYNMKRQGFFTDFSSAVVTGSCPQTLLVL